MNVELSPEMIQALLALCDGVPLRGPESKIVVAGAQAALLEALREGKEITPDAVPGEKPGRPADRPEK